MAGKATVFLFLYLSVLAQGANAAITFETSTISGFNGPYHITTADFNNDTKPDLAVTNFPGNELIILLGDGLGNYSVASTLATGVHPNFIAAGDFDNSGSIDLAVTNLGGERDVTLFFNDGTGSSWTPSTLSLGNDADVTSVVAANFTPSTDSNIDLFIVKNSGAIADFYEVWQGDGTGAFTEIASANTGEVPYFAAAGDFNGDTNLDIAIANYDSNSLTILLGGGDRTFSEAPGSPITVGTRPCAIAVGHLNGDAYIDLAVMNLGDNTVSMLLGNGDGTFSAAAFNVTFGGGGVAALVISDFDGDGKNDIAVGWYFANAASIYRGNGDGTFDPTSTYFFVGTGPAFIASGDFDKDGKPDLAVTNYNSNDVTILLNRGGQCVQAPSGLLAWWSGDGHPLDLIGTNDGTLVNGAIYAAGKVGLAFSFDGVDDYVDAGTSEVFNFSNGTGNFTIDAWINPSNFPETASGIVTKATQSPFSGWAFYAYSDGRLGFGGVGIWELASAPGTITTGTWAHVAVTRSGDTYTLYKNGVPVVSVAHAGPLQTSSTALRIGTDYVDTYRFQGLIDELSVLNRALDSSEIEAIYNAGSAGKCKPCVPPPSGLVSWWTGDGDADDVIGTNHGTLQSGATFAEGIVGQAFSFDGVDDYVSVPHTSALDVTGGDFTIGAWIYPTWVGVNGEGIIGKLSSDNTSGWGFAVQGSNYGAPGKINFFSDSGWAGQSSEAVSLYVWTHVAVTRSGNSLTYYVNGSPSGAFTRTGNFDNALSLTIGEMYSSYPSSTFKFSGFIDEVGIFNRALSPDEIAATYAAGSAGMCLPPPIPTYTITASVPGGNGTINCASPVNQGDSSTCTITPDTGYHLATLTDNAVSVIGSVSNGQYIINNVTADHDVVGSFSIDTFSLSITRLGTGSGTVTSDPAGINCGSTCDSLFDSGTLVTLTATPAIGSFFSGWTGDCNADGEVTMTAGRSCTATFTSYTALQVQAPNGGEDLMAGQSYTIRWGAPAAMETFNILYSLDGGLTWKKEATKTSGNSYPWTVPVPAGSGNKKKCLVRVIGFNGQGTKVATDTSDHPFLINHVRLDSHTGGQFLDAGTTVPVTWTRRAGLSATTAKIYYSLNQGVIWVYSGKVNADAGQYDWQVPLTKKPTATCRVKVTLFNGATVVGSDKSDGNFTIRTVEVLDPNGGEPLTGGQAYDVSYYVYTRHAYAGANVYLSLDGGQTWKLAGQQGPVGAPGPATLSITLPNVATTKKNCKLKVQLVDEESKMLTNDTSDAVFTISRL